jgi:membrane-bound lytic murein transglycosylase F
VPVHEKYVTHEKKVAVALSTSNSSYFIYKAQPVGYQHDLINAFSQEINTNVRFIVANTLDERLQLLESGDVSFIVLSKDETDSISKNKDIYTSVAINSQEPFTWAVSSDNPRLLSKINLFLSNFISASDYRIIRWKYFEAKTNMAEAAKQDKSLSEYDDLIKKYSENIGWDWRLLASLIYQESRFMTDLSSRKGAYGLMQLMPVTALTFGYEDMSDPETNIQAGTAFLRFLDKQIGKIDEIDGEERIKFILASYNAGLARIVEDCRAYTSVMDKDPNIWTNVASTIPLLSHPGHYTNDTLSYGRFKGKETLHFVEEIMERYHHYQNLIDY